VVNRPSGYGMLQRMPVIPPFSDQQLEAIAKQLGAMLTGSEITRVLQQAEIYKDVLTGETKWKRLLAAFQLQQRSDHSGNRVARAAEIAMAPVRYTNAADQFTIHRERLNTVLAFASMQLGEDGHLRSVDPTSTLTEAQRRAKSLYQRLAQRGAHRAVLKYCTAELLADNYFHAVLEASKGLFEALRVRTRLDADGTELIDQALGIPKGGGAPRVAFNSLRTESERSEQRGLVNLFKGVAGTFRNPTAHAPRISWSMSEQDALDLLTLVSMLHRRLDQAIDVPRASS
jgi:uncharacterized protein (TIGR02391 family)